MITGCVIAGCMPIAAPELVRATCSSDCTSRLEPDTGMPEVENARCAPAPFNSASLPCSALTLRLRSELRRCSHICTNHTTQHAQHDGVSLGANEIELCTYVVCAYYSRSCCAIRQEVLQTQRGNDRPRARHTGKHVRRGRACARAALHALVLEKHQINDAARMDSWHQPRERSTPQPL